MIFISQLYQKGEQLRLDIIALIRLKTKGYWYGFWLRIRLWCGYGLWNRFWSRARLSVRYRLWLRSRGGLEKFLDNKDTINSLARNIFG